MSNLNSLPDLSTVDIQAIADSGSPVHPRISLPPLTTIAENWDTLVRTENSILADNEGSSSEDDEDESDEEQEKSPRKIQDSKSLRASCSSSSNSSGLDSDSSSSEHSDATSDSAGSSTSSSDSESDSPSSVSSSSCKSRPHHTTKPANNKDHQSFSVREANYDKGRLTLRLSSLQVEKKLNHEESYHELKQPYSISNGHTLRADKLESTPNSAFNAVIKSPPNLVQRYESPTLTVSKPTTSIIKDISPVKRERQLRPRPSPEPTKVEATIIKPIASKIQSPKQVGTRPRGRPSSKKLESPSSSAVSCKKDDSKANANKSHKGKICLANSGSQQEPSVASSSQHRHANSGPSLSDLDTNSDESNLPDVSEAIRLLDLDSQGPAHSDTSAPMSAFHQPGGAPSVAGLRMGFGGSSGVHHAWPSVGYCSSLLQQFVAKSQSGEPPPPPPPTSAVLQLPTKGARKCFPVNNDTIPSVPVDKSFKRSGGDSLRSTFSAVGGGGHADHDLDTMIPMRGLDIHPSHVSPDSGIQSVSGSPFSVHSSPNHPSGGGAATCNSNSNNQQQTASLSSPCPPVSPSPPPQLKRSGKKSGSGRKSVVTAAAATTVANDTKATSSHKNQPPPPVAAAGKIVERRNSSGSRRPRSCRDTASALSSGLGKDSITFQAIQRGIDAARRLTSRNASEEEEVDPKGNIPSITSQVPASKMTSTTSKKLKKKGTTDRKRSRKPKMANTSALSIPEDPPSFVSGKQPVLVFPRGTIDPVSVVRQVNDPKPPGRETVLSDVSLRRRKKQKHKKHKSSRQKAKLAPAAATIHPTLLTSLDELCRRLHRCAISRSVVAGSRKRLLVFQCRKYNPSNSASAIGSVCGSTSGHGRGKRKKIEDAAISTISASTTSSATTNPVVTGTTKRKNKPKKSASQSVLSSHSVSTNATSNSTKLESSPAVNLSPSAKGEDASTSASVTAVELLLPLKKRHHHLAASDNPASSIETSSKVNSSSSYPASEKPSHDQAATKSTQQQQNNRKRPASKEPEALNSVNNRTNSEENAPPAKKKRGRKKITQSVEIAPLSQGEQTLPAKTPSPVVNEIPTVHADDSDTVNKKKTRRRKTFNRTGFPSAKKKRKKTPTPLPPPFASSSEQTTCKKRSVAAPDSKTSLPAVSIGLETTNCPKKSKRPKLSVKEEDSESIVTAEPTSSEAPSGDELNPSSAAAAAVAALVASVKNQKPTKKRTRATNNLRKRYLPAGLLSKYFKEDINESTASGANGTGTVESTKEVGRVERSKSLTYDPDEHEHGLLPAPYYCERYLRRTRRDFQLPFDLWWQHQEGKLPGRESMVPSWNYRKIRNNVYYDVKPPYTNDAEPCNCTLPPPDATKEEIDARCCGDDCLNRMVYTECSGQMCPVGDKCMNQRIQRHRWAQGLERFMTTEKGWGVRCRNVLKSGEFILEYVGEVVSDREFKERMHTVYVHDTHHYCLHLDGGLVIDGHRMGGDGRFVNHSCAPNCEMQKWSVNGLPRMALFALRDISPFEELSYDYNFSLFNPAEGQPCKCGSAQCRGVIGGKSQRVNMIQQDAANNKQVVPKANQQKRKRKTGQQGKTPLAVCSLSINPRPLSSQQRAFVLLRRCFLLRNLDKVRDWRDQQKDRMKQAQLQQNQQQSAGRSRRFISRPSLDQPETKEPAAVSPPSIEDQELPSASQIQEQQVHSPALDPPGVCMTMEEAPDENEEVVRCRCRLYDDEGLMVQCEQCETWQHIDCFGPEKSKIALEAVHYVCHACAGEVLHSNDLNIVLEPQPENPPEGQTYYLSLTYKDMQVRQGDCVYVLRDHDSADSERTLWSCVSDSTDLPRPRPPHHLPPHLQLAKLDIFQIERMWIDETGKRFVWGHHFFRPHETFHEPSRKFYVNEVLVSPIYESIPLWAVFGRCWVLDPVTFCKGRPADAIEEHVYICEYRIDRGARLFTKMSRSKIPLCLRSFAFKSFVTKLKPQRTYQPHGAPPPNSRKQIEFPAPAGTTPGADSLKKSDAKTKIKSKINKTEVHPPPTSAPPSKTAQKQTKIQQQKLRLDQLLRQLLVKRTPEGSDVLDASHLLKRNITTVSKQKSGRMRGRPPKNKSDTKGPSTSPSSPPST